jgi:hypothetical protein
LDIQFIETEENDSLEIIDTEEENESSNMVDNNPTHTVDNNLSDELSDEIPLKIMNNQLDNSDSSKIVKPISLEKTEGLSYNNEMDDIPFEIKMTNDEIEVPTTIKSIPDENLDSDQNEGSQLGLF